MIHAPIHPTVRRISSEAILTDLYGALPKAPYPKTLLYAASLGVSPAFVYTAFPPIIGPHRVRAVGHQETKNLTGNDSLHFLVSQDSRTDAAIRQRDLSLLNPSIDGPFLQFVTTMQTIPLNLLMPRAFTVYKLGYLNQSPGSAIVSAFIQLDL